MPQPNILIIYSDQHRYDCAGVNGHALVQTPAMDRLAAEGANFTHAFTPTPICIPARCSMLTGRWPAQHRTITNFDGETFKRLDTDLPTCPAVLRDAGYHTIHIGRWHVDQQRSPLDFGFHDYLPDWRYGHWRKAQGLPAIPHDGGPLGCIDPHATPEQSALGWSADQVIDRMERVQDQGTSPFFIRWHMIEPHLPCRPVEPYASMYDPADIPPWPGFADDFAGKPWIQRQMPRTWGIDEMTWDDWAPAVARYLGTISLLDSQLARVLGALERLGIADDTLVVYTSDHGDMCGSHHMIDKHFILYDDVVRVPMMMRWPGRIPAGRVVDDFVANAVDLPTTFCEAAGVESPDTFSGESLLPSACGTGRIDRTDMTSMYAGNQFGGYSQRMLRDRRWKYIWNATDVDELYDLDADPGELTNLADDAAYADELARLRGRLVAWMEETDDAMLNGWTRRVLESSTA
jgi:arylsulfatase A-like enzyme